MESKIFRIYGQIDKNNGKSVVLRNNLTKVSLKSKRFIHFASTIGIYRDESKNIDFPKNGEFEKLLSFPISKTLGEPVLIDMKLPLNVMIIFVIVGLISADNIGWNRLSNNVNQLRQVFKLMIRAQPVIGCYSKVIDLIG